MFTNLYIYFLLSIIILLILANCYRFHEFEFYLAIVGFLYALYLLYVFEEPKQEHFVTSEESVTTSEESMIISEESTFQQIYDVYVELPQKISTQFSSDIDYAIGLVTEGENNTTAEDDKSFSMSIDYYQQQKPIDPSLLTGKYVDEEKYDTLEADYNLINVFLMILQNNNPSQYNSFISKFS